MGGEEEEEERSSPLSGASFSEIMGDMLAGRPALPRYPLLEWEVLSCCCFCYV